MEEFVKPADLFKKRRISGALSSTSFTITSNSISNNNNNNNNSSSNKSSCPTTTTTTTISPFMSAVTSMRPKSKLVAQSPMKCLSNLTDPSPTKKLPVVLKNPFNQPVKRRLQLGDSPMKRHSSSTSSSPRKSPVKKASRMFEMNDEDANLEPPKMKHQLMRSQMSPMKRMLHQQQQQYNNRSVCFQNDWTLKSKLLVSFPNRCKNWSLSSTTTHKRHSGNLMDEDTPSKVNDRTISLEAIKNAATYYQHPYLPWLTLFPRKVGDKTAIVASNDQEKKQAQFAMSKHPAAIKAMLKAWCESLDDITNLLLDGKCPFFYLCSDFKTMLFKRSTSYHDVQIFITPFNLDFGLTLTKHGIDYKSDISEDLENNNENTNSCNSQQQQQMFGSFNSNTMLDSQLSSFSLMNSQQKYRSKNFNESNPYSNIDEELGLDDEDDDVHEQTSEAIFESIGIKGGWSELDAKKPDTKLAGTIEVKNSTILSSSKSLGVVEGVENVRKFIKLMQTNKTHTINNIGEFASIPPTIISPREFRLSTPQYPEVVIIKSKDFNKMASNSTTSSSSGIVNTPNSLLINNSTQSSQSSSVADELSQKESGIISDVRVRILTQSSSNFDEGIQIDDTSQSSLMATDTSSKAQIKSAQTNNNNNNDTIVVGPGSFELQGPILPSLYRKLHKLLLVSDNSNHICSATQLSSSIPFGMLRFPLSH